MTPDQRAELLRLLDYERQHVPYPGVTRIADGAVVRDVALDGTYGEVCYCSCLEDEIDGVIARQIETARRGQYDLEWKVYGHDRPPTLSDHLLAAGFDADEPEAFMVLVTSADTLNRFGERTADIRRIASRTDLRDYQTIVEEVRGRSCALEIEEYARTLETDSHTLSLYVAYVDGEPAACGRVYFNRNSRFAGLYGGNTRERFRKRGLFTQLVAARVREALERGIVYISVDALPTSEPILAKRGFEKLTWTQPFHFAVTSG